MWVCVGSGVWVGGGQVCGSGGVRRVGLYGVRRVGLYGVRYVGLGGASGVFVCIWGVRCLGLCELVAPTGPMAWGLGLGSSE